MHAAAGSVLALSGRGLEKPFISLIHSDASLQLSKACQPLNGTALCRNPSSGKYDCEALDQESWSYDWCIPPTRLKIMTRDDGAPWQLGAGSYGSVSQSSCLSCFALQSTCAYHGSYCPAFETFNAKALSCIPLTSRSAAA